MLTTKKTIVDGCELVGLSSLTSMLESSCKENDGSAANAEHAEINTIIQCRQRQHEHTDVIITIIIVIATIMLMKISFSTLSELASVVGVVGNIN